MPTLGDLFTVRNGLPTTGLTVYPATAEGRVIFLRPSNSLTGTVAGFIDRTSVAKENIYPAESVIVSTNGDGSHSFSYVFPTEFACNSDVSILEPKKPLGLAEKLFYAQAITRNRWLFSYGRKPKGNRLKAIRLPDLPALPSWVSPDLLDKYKGKDAAVIDGSFVPLSLSDVKLVPLSDLFDASYGNKFDLNKMTLNKRGVNFIGRTAKNNGVSAKVARVPGVSPQPAGALTVALGGSILSTFLQPEPFYTAQNIAVLYPKTDMSPCHLLFYASAIQANKFRYGAFGREANRTFRSMIVPVPTSQAGWKKIEQMIKVLSFSSQVE